MRLFALELNNDIKGLEERKKYIESIIAKIEQPDFVVLPELALPSYMASQEVWKYADNNSQDTIKWAVDIAKKYQTYLGVGYIDKEDGHFYNRYLIAGAEGYYGKVTKSEGEAAVFRRGEYDNIIETPLGKIAIAICYDSRRKLFYDHIKDQEISLILFPHGSPADPKQADAEIKTIDYIGNTYVEAFNVPVVYVNCKGKLESMPGKMGAMMEKLGFMMNGRTKIFAPKIEVIETGIPEVFGANLTLTPQKLQKPIKFYGNDLVKGNWLFRKLILLPDIKVGIRLYESNRQ